MTRETIRLANLRKIVKQFRTYSELAEACGTNEKYISQIMTGTLLPSGKRRGIGNGLAKKLEEAARKEPGWMDVDHDNGGTVITRTDMTEDEAELLRLYRESSKIKQLTILAVARL